MVAEPIDWQGRAEAAEQVVRGLGVGVTVLRQLHRPLGHEGTGVPSCGSCGCPWPCPSAQQLYTEAEVAQIYRDPVREALADYAHDAWAGWMTALFGHSWRNEDGSVVIPAELVERWDRQRLAPYAELPPEEQDSDRHEADRMLQIVGQFGGA